MTRYRLILGLALAAVLAPVVMMPARAITVTRKVEGMVVTTEDRKIETTLATRILARYYDVPVTKVEPLYPRYGFDKTAMLLALSRESGHSIASIDRDRSRGIGWGQVAHRLGVHPGTFNQQRVWAKKHDQTVAAGYGDSVLARYYGMTPATIRDYRARGYDFGHTLIGLNVHQLSGKSFDEVLKARARQSSWDATTKEFGLTPDKAKAAPAPKEKFSKGQGKGKPEAKSPGKPQGGGPGKGKGKPN